MDVETQKPPLSETWTRWEGQSVNGAFPLRRCLGSSDHSGVFLTEYAERNLSNAALKLVPAIPTLAESQLSYWGATASLEHPHLLSLFETGRCQLGGLHYLYAVMEYAEQNLAQLLQHRALSEAEVREMLPLTLDALAFLHSRDFVHGQLKPSNVLVVGNRLALASDNVRPADEATASIGTLSIYDPPEARDGSFSTAGDIWALGVTLCQALTQRTPLRSGERRDLVVLPPDIPVALNTILRRCLSGNPAERPSVADLQEWLKKGPAAEPARVSAAPGAVAPASVSVTEGAAAPAPAPVAAGKAERNDGPTRLVIRAVINSEPPPEAVAERRSFVPLIVGAVAVVAVGWGAVSWYRGQSATSPATADQGSTAVSQAPNSSASAQSPDTPASSAGATSEGAAASGSTSSGRAPGQAAAQGPSQASGSSVAPARGSSATSAPAVTSVVQEDIPSVSAHVRATIHGHVKVSVRVTVDNSGTVVRDDLVRAGPSKYFARLASESARRWRFEPAGGSGSRQSLIRFDFSRSGTTAHVVSSD